MEVYILKCDKLECRERTHNIMYSTATDLAIIGICAVSALGRGIKERLGVRLSLGTYGTC